MGVTEVEVVVLGLGAVGSAALLTLADNGIAALGIDRFVPGHDRGSSHGETRVIRMAYFEDPSYVPLLKRAYTLWDGLEERSNKKLFTRSGVLEIGHEDGVVIPGVQHAAGLHNLPIENLSADEVTARFPGMVVPEGMVGVFEPDAGFLPVEECIRLQVQLADTAGADVWSNTEITGWTSQGDRYQIETARGPVIANRVIITAGAWAADLLCGLSLPLEVHRKVLLWFGASEKNRHCYTLDAGQPVFLYEMASDVFYGFPIWNDRGLKVARHTGDDIVADPLHNDRRLHPKDIDPVSRFLAATLPHIESTSVRHHAVCMYTMTPDAHPIVGSHPDHPGVSFAAGLSGHGFKFSNALGELLALRALGKEAAIPEIFSLLRFAGRSSIADPT